MTTVHAIARALHLSLAAGLAAATIVGCTPGNGKYTQEFQDQATDRMERVKAGTSWDMARQQFLSGDLEKALKTVDKSLAHAADVPKSHVLRGRILVELGRLETAIDAFDLALDIDPEFTQAHYYRGIVHERWADYQQAFEAYSAAAGIDPTDPQYVVAAAEMLIQLDAPDRAQALLISSEEHFEHNAGVQQTLGHLAVMRGDLDAAIERFQEACLLAPDETGLIEDLARAQIAKGDFAEAEYSLSRLMRRASDDGEPRRDLQHLHARCLLELDRPVDARNIYDALTSDERGNADFAAWLGMGETALMLDDHYRLNRAASQLVAMAPNRHEGHLLRAIVQRDSGHLRAAVRTLDTAIDLCGNDPEPAILQAVIYEQLGDFPQAERAARVALKLDPANSFARRLLRSIDNTDETRIADVPIDPDN
jgi:tetratricopeptide (TPR) repeat protein